MASYKFVGELHFEAEDMNDAQAKLGEHFLKQSRGEVSHLLDEGSSCAMGEPEFDTTLDSIKLTVLELEEVDARG